MGRDPAGTPDKIEEKVRPIRCTRRGLLEAHMLLDDQYSCGQRRMTQRHETSKPIQTAVHPCGRGCGSCRWAWLGFMQAGVAGVHAGERGWGSCRWAWLGFMQVGVAGVHAGGHGWGSCR